MWRLCRLYRHNGTWEWKWQFQCAVFLRSHILTRVHWLCIKKEKTSKTFTSVLHAIWNFFGHFWKLWNINLKQQSSENFERIIFQKKFFVNFENIILLKKRFQQKKTTGDKRDENQQQAIEKNNIKQQTTVFLSETVVSVKWEHSGATHYIFISLWSPQLHLAHFQRHADIVHAQWY